ARAAGDGEGAPRRQRGDELRQLGELLLPARPFAVGEASLSEPPLVVFGGARVVVALHRLPRVRACASSNRCRTSPRDGTGGSSTRSPTRWERTLGCWTFTRTRITTVRSSRSSAPRSSSSRRCSPACARHVSS